MTPQKEVTKNSIDANNRGRVIDNELHPNTTTFGTATVTVTGASATGSGSISIKAGNVTSSASYAAGQSAAQVANALLAGFNQNSNSVVTASVLSGTYTSLNSSGQVACSSGVVPNSSTPCAVVSLQAIVAGQYGDVPLTVSSSGASFATASTGLALTGGAGSPQGPGNAYVYTLAYDKAGNLASSTDAYNGSFNYTYDTLNRLTTESNTGYEGPGYATTAGKVNYQCWNYDSFGNRIFELDSNSACPTTALTQSTSTHSESYNANNQILR